MLQEYRTEDVVTLIVALNLLGSFLCFVKLLINANLNAWSNIVTDKAIAEEEDENNKGKKKRGKRMRIPEKRLWRDAWFGGTCGLVAMVWRWHKVRKPLFLLRYCCQCCIGVFITVTALFLYLVLALPHVVLYWASAKDLLLHFAEWSEQLRPVLHF